MKALRIVFMGTPDFAVPSLKALSDAGHEIACVYTQPPRPAGRGQKERPSPVHQFAQRRGIPVETPSSLRDPREHVRLAAIAPDAVVVAAYGLILPRAILGVPRLGCINVHASLLPRWRGAAPIQHAILAGDNKTGVTIMQMDAGLDTGDILLAQATRITRTTTASSLHDRLATLGAKLIVTAMDGLAAGTITPTAQPEQGVTYASRLSRDDGQMDWRDPADRLERKVRALNPWPGAWFIAPVEGGKTARIRVLRAALDQTTGDAPPGTVLPHVAGAEHGLRIACGAGALKLVRLQREGRAPLDAGPFLRGFALPAGMVLPASDGGSGSS